MPQVIVTVSPAGEVEVEARGVSGPACHKLTAGIEAALGRITKDIRTTEFFRSDRATASQKVRG